MNLEKTYNNMNKSEFYSMNEGSNRMRVMTDFQEVQSINRGQEFKGYVSEDNQPQAGDVVRTQAWAWAIIRGDEKKGTEDELAIVKFGKNILGQLVGLKNNPEYAFDEAPLPYDIDVQTKNAGELTVIYTVVPARKNTEVTASEMELLNKKNPVSEIVAKMIAKQSAKASGNFGDYEKKAPYPESNNTNNASAF